MFLTPFNGEQFFHETVLPAIASTPDFAADSKLPVDYGTIPVLDLDDRERFVFHSCRLGYFSLGRNVEVGLVAIEHNDDLPRRVASVKFSLPGERPLNGIVIGRQGTHTVAGLRDSNTDEWHKVSGYKDINRHVLLIIRKKLTGRAV